MWKKQKRVDIINLKVWDNIPLNIMDNTLLSANKGDIYGIFSLGWTTRFRYEI